MIHESIKKLAKPIDAMLPLEGNPRRGDIDAIAASYSEFGQVKPIVVKDNGDETFTVIAGNHQVAAARKLGWSEIAAVVLDADDKRAVAFALADNRTMELGHSDQAQVIAMIEQISSEYPELLSDMRWDEFEIAAMDEWVEKNVDDTEDELNDGYVPPTFVGSVDLSKVDLSKDDAGETKLTAKAASTQLMLSPVEVLLLAHQLVGRQ